MAKKKSDTVVTAQVRLTWRTWRGKNRKKVATVVVPVDIDLSDVPLASDGISARDMRWEIEQYAKDRQDNDAVVSQTIDNTKELVAAMRAYRKKKV